MGWLDKPLLYLGSRPIKINQGAKHVVRGHLVQKLLSENMQTVTETCTHRMQCSTWTTKVVGKSMTVWPRSTGTVHTFAKARLTSVAIRIRIHDPDRHQNLITHCLTHFQRPISYR